MINATYLYTQNTDIMNRISRLDVACRLITETPPRNVLLVTNFIRVTYMTSRVAINVPLAHQASDRPPDLYPHTKHLTQSSTTNTRSECTKNAALIRSRTIEVEWLYWTTSRGGMGLTNIAVLEQNLKLYSLCGAVSPVFSLVWVPRWIASCLLQFTTALEVSIPF